MHDTFLWDGGAIVSKLRMEILVRSFVRAAGALMVAILFFAGCASHKERTVFQPFGAIGPNADIYIFAPVAGNEPLLTALLTVFVPEKTAQQYLKRTSALHIGVRYEKHSTVSLASTGSYPVGLSGLVFSQKDGWEKRTVLLKDYEGHGAYYHSRAADVVLEQHAAYSLLGDSTRNVDDFLYRIIHPQNPVFPARFQSLLDGGGEIGLYARSGSLAAGAVLGMQGIELPLQSIELYLKKGADSTYHYSAVFKAPHARAALVLKMLISTVLHGTVSVQDAAVFVDSGSISEAELVALFQTLAGT